MYFTVCSTILSAENRIINVKHAYHPTHIAVTEKAPRIVKQVCRSKIKRKTQPAVSFNFQNKTREWDRKKMILIFGKLLSDFWETRPPKLRDFIKQTVGLAKFHLMHYAFWGCAVSFFPRRFYDVVAARTAIKTQILTRCYTSILL